MPEPQSSYLQRIQECQAAIVRIRRARADGDYNSPAVAGDFTFVLTTVAPMFQRKARVFQGISPLLVEEAFETMVNTLKVDVCKSTYPSLEQQLGARIKSIGMAVIGAIRRKNSLDGRLLYSASFDASDGEALSHYDTTPDPHGENAFTAVEDTAMLAPLLAQLSPKERWVLELKYLEGKKGVEIARELGISEVAVSRLLKAAIGRLSRLRAASGA